MLLRSIFKNKGSRDDPNNYRGISIMGAFPKLFASSLNIILEESILNQQLRANNQAGFRKGFRVEDNSNILRAVIQ
jgi:hypothetical protein